MRKILTKPNKELPSQDVYPQEIVCIYEKLAAELTEVQLDDFDDLMENIYKVAYIDGIKDILHYYDLRL